MGRYEPLRAFLDQQSGEQVRLSFAEIEAILGVALPNSKRYPAWWSNNPSNNPMTKVWLSAGFVTEQVDTSRETLVFRRRATAAAPGVAEQPSTFHSDPSRPPPPGDWLAKLRARLGGTVQTAPDWDLTQPTGEVWDAARE